MGLPNPVAVLYTRVHSAPPEIFAIVSGEGQEMTVIYRGFFSS